MTQPDVALTDFGLAVECGYFAYRMMLRTEAQTIAGAFGAFFLSISLAAAVGGIVHGFFMDETSSGYRVLWPMTMLLIGVTACTGIHIAAKLQFSAPTARSITKIAFVVFMVYIFIILFVRRDFLIAILDYVPSLIFLATALLLKFRNTEHTAYLIGFLGIMTMFLAAITQQLKLGIDPHYFNHNALYHVLQGIALFMIYRAARQATDSAETNS